MLKAASQYIQHMAKPENRGLTASYCQQDPVTPHSPLTRTLHPTNPFQDDEEKALNAVKARSMQDEPVTSDEVCQDRYAIPIGPDYKNPKLLAQFISPHTGFTYKKNITGLCEHMQQKVEKEVIKAQRFGFMAEMIKEAHYLKDHKLFDPARPARKNPY